MVLFQISLIGQQRVEEVCAGEWRINRVIDHFRRIAGASHGHSAKGKVVVPGEEVELSVVFIEIIVVCHGTGQTVHVYSKGMDGHVFQDIVNVQIGFQIRSFADVFQRRHDLAVIRVAGSRDFTLPDQGVAVQIVIRVVQVRAAVSADREAAHIGRTEAAFIRLAAGVKAEALG